MSASRARALACRLVLEEASTGPARASSSLPASPSAPSKSAATCFDVGSAAYARSSSSSDVVGREAARDARGAQEEAALRCAASSAVAARAVASCATCGLPRAALGLHVFEARARFGVLAAARRERTRVRARRLVVVAEVAEHVAELEEQRARAAARPCACAAPARGASAPCSTCRGSSRRSAPPRGSRRARDSACTRPGSASAL